MLPKEGKKEGRKEGRKTKKERNKQRKTRISRRKLIIKIKPKTNEIGNKTTEN
jgi:hypothetical protein